MATAKEIREDIAKAKLIEQLDPEIQDRIASGEVEVRADRGEKGNLILVDSKTKRYVKGTDRAEGSPDMAKIGKENAFRNTTEYREAWQRMFNLAGDQGGVGFEELMSKLWWAANGAEQLVPCTHDGCGKRHMVAFKPDSKVLFQMVESVIGRASQQVEHTGQVGHVHDILREAALDDSPIEVWSVNPQDPEGEAERRKQNLLEAGVIEADWFEVKEDAPSDDA